MKSIKQVTRIITLVLFLSIAAFAQAPGVCTVPDGLANRDQVWIGCTGQLRTLREWASQLNVTDLFSVKYNLPDGSSVDGRVQQVDLSRALVNVPPGATGATSITFAKRGWFSMVIPLNAPVVDANPRLRGEFLVSFPKVNTTFTGISVNGVARLPRVTFRFTFFGSGFGNGGTSWIAVVDGVEIPGNVFPRSSGITEDNATFEAALTAGTHTLYFYDTETGAVSNTITFTLFPGLE